MNYNYDINNGVDLNRTNEKLTLTNTQSSNCTECGAILNPKENYCYKCGKSNLQVSQATITKPTVQKPTREKYTPVKIDYKRNIISIVLTIVVTGIALAMISAGMSASLGIDTSYYDATYPSKFQTFFTNLSLMSIPNITIAAQSGSITIGEVSIAFRHLTYPLISIVLIFISVKICVNEDNLRENTLYHSIAYAVMYAIAMVFVGIIGSYIINFGEGEIISVSIGLVSLFINSLIIGFVGVHLAIYKYGNGDIISYLILKAIKIILIALGVTTIVVGAMCYIKLNGEYNIIQTINPYLGENKMFVYITMSIGLLMIVSWIFALANFASISIFGAASYNIVSLSQQLDLPVILFCIIPIVLFIILGRNLKTKYGNGQIKIIGAFSGVYAIAMCGFAYLTRFLLKVNAQEVLSEISNFIYDELGYFFYYYFENMLVYINNVSEKLSSGVYFGSDGFVMIVAAFIFSFVFVYVGYLTKSIENK